MKSDKQRPGKNVTDWQKAYEESEARLLVALQRNLTLRITLDATHKLISEGALVGFIPTEGTWAERLFKNQHNIFEALRTK